MSMSDLHPQIPRLALGTFQIDNSIIVQTIKSAIDLGYRHIDTAAAYQNEEFVGQAISESSVPRDQLFITTKVWPTRYREVRTSVQESLNKLRIDYIDLMLLHWPIALKKPDNPNALPQDGFELDIFPMQQVWEQLEAVKEEGLVKNIGVSNFPVSQILDILSYARYPPLVNQIELHPYHPQITDVDSLFNIGVLPFAYASLGSAARPYSSREGTPEVLQDPLLAEIGAKYGMTPAQVCIKYGLQRGYGVIAKASSVERLQQNFDSQNFVISEEDMQRLLRIGNEAQYFNFAISQERRWIITG